MSPVMAKQSRGNPTRTWSQVMSASLYTRNVSETMMATSVAESGHVLPVDVHSLNLLLIFAII